ncbi:FAD-dependent oxidoreductase [Telmatobacter bradus]|uniref:FAD-dependent oxidoreductase n=1 Tax=Telmatobacter bradus TaxID=474953 RepID=UPI003B428011
MKYYDLLVIGGGPGGMAAATLAAEDGLRVCLVDENSAPGGQIWRGVATGKSASHATEFHHWARRLFQSGAQVLSGHRVVARVAPHTLRLEANGAAEDVGFQQLILATGARERLLPFPGWTLPGVMGAGGLQAFMKAGFDPKGRRVVLAGTGPLLFPVAALAKQKGAQLVGLFEQASVRQMLTLLPALATQPAKLLEGAGYTAQIFPVQLQTGRWVVRAEGKEKLEAVVVTDGHNQQRIACDLLAVGYHLVPNLELPQLFDCAEHSGYVQVDELQRTSVEGVFCVGELTGIGGLNKALVEAKIAALTVAGKLEKACALRGARRRQYAFAHALDAAYKLRSELFDAVTGDTIICRCEDIRHKDLRNTHDWRAAKLSTRCGMGACQGRTCGSATKELYGWPRQSMRPPVTPATVATLAAEVEMENNAPVA